jgi:proline iminopeptidase
VGVDTIERVNALTPRAALVAESSAATAVAAMRIAERDGLAHLYADSPVNLALSLPVSGMDSTPRHVLNVQVHGSDCGIPVVVLHGGPGSATTPLLRRFLDPQRFRIVCLDQRGAGRSTPRGETTDNTTADLLADLRAVRRLLRIERWLVVGGSWGATLALAHALNEPEAIRGLLLRGTFLARSEDIDHFFSGAGGEQPQAWAAFSSMAPPERRAEVLDVLAERLACGGGEASTAALAWWRWESMLATGTVGKEPAGEALGALIDRYRVQAHYLRHGCWIGQPPLLDRVDGLPPVPIHLLHGSADRVCRAAGAIALHERLGSRASIDLLDNAGHDPTHPAMVDAMVRALDNYANSGEFVCAESGS